MPQLVYVLTSCHSNWKSVSRVLEDIGYRSIPVTLNEINTLQLGSTFIWPGVGNLKQLDEEVRGLFEPRELKQLMVDLRLKVVGICLGFQYLCQWSEEYLDTECLGFFDCGVAKLFESSKPSVGWKSTELAGFQNNRDNGLNKSESFYYTHSFGVIDLQSSDAQSVLAKYQLPDGRSIVGAISSKSVTGIQFHPEKSGISGKRFLAKCINQLEN
jgi:glutamine amidotransferase